MEKAPKFRGFFFSGGCVLLSGAFRRGPCKVCRNSLAGLVMLPGLEFWAEVGALSATRPGSKRSLGSVRQPTALARPATERLRLYARLGGKMSILGAFRRRPCKVCRNSLAGLVMLPGLEFWAEVEALFVTRPGSKRCPGSVRQPTALARPATEGLRTCARLVGRYVHFLGRSIFAGRSKMVRCKEAKKSRARGVLGR